MWSNDMKYKYMFMIPLNNLAHKVLMLTTFLWLQQVMRFAEMTQEVQVARPQQVRFDIGLTKGRRRLNQQFKENIAKVYEEGGEEEHERISFKVSNAKKLGSILISLLLRYCQV